MRVPLALAPGVVCFSKCTEQSQIPASSIPSSCDRNCCLNIFPYFLRTCEMVLVIRFLLGTVGIPIHFLPGKATVGRELDLASLPLFEDVEGQFREIKSLLYQMCVGVPSHLPLANLCHAFRLDHSRIMGTSLFTFDSCIKIIQTSPRLRRHLTQAALFVSSEYQVITKPLHPASLRSCFLGQLLVVPPMYRRILRQT